MAGTTFFYPNICHVCKRWDVELMSCAECQMISYCNEKHQQVHLPQHKDICAAIKHVLGDKKYMNTEEISTYEWTNIRTEYKNKVSVILKRHLKLEEIEMFHYPKACVVCHRQDTVNRCNRCPSAAFCDKHRDEPEHGQTYCKLLRDSYEAINFVALTKSIVPYFDRFPNMAFFHNMDSFLDIYLPLDENNVYLRMLHSRQISHVLTVFFCIEKLYGLGCETLSIHVIGRHVISIRNEMIGWNLLFNLLSTLTTLHITFIQAGSVFNERNIPEILKISETKKLVVNVCCMSYNEYIATTAYKKPNLIVGFHAAVIDDNFPIHVGVDISAFVDRNCSLILIFDHLYPRVEQMLHKINKFFFGKNPFLDLLPYRHFPTERILYSNNYVIIFNGLACSRIFIPKGDIFLLHPK